MKGFWGGGNGNDIDYPQYFRVLKLYYSTTLVAIKE